MKYVISFLLISMISSLSCTQRNPAEEAKAEQEARALKAKEEFEKKLDAEFNNPVQPNLSEKRPVRGDNDAKVAIVIYSDFQCPFCSRGFVTMEKIREKYPTQVKFIFKHMPLDQHSAAEIGARYFEAIGLQSEEKAWQFHDTMFTHQEELGAKAEAFMKETAKKLKVDMKRLAKDIKSELVTSRLNADSRESRKFRFTGAPSFSVGGVRVIGAKGLPLFERIIERHLKPKS